MTGSRQTTLLRTSLGYRERPKRIAEKMAALGCSQAERLVWAYLGALGDSGKAYSEFVRAIESGPTGLIASMSKKMKVAIAGVTHARSAFQQHCKEHDCCSPAVISPSPSPRS